jgi:hypothetical protein
VGIRSIDLGDWPRAVKNLSGSLESIEALYGRHDRKYMEVVVLLNKATAKRESLAFDSVDVNKVGDGLR